MILPRSVESKIFALCRGARGRETGGIIVGRYTPDRATAIIGDATPPPRDSRSGRTWFHRGVSGLRSFLTRLWSQPNREYYLGEWHHHPAEVVSPSTDDQIQMERISEDGSYRCPEPVLIIVGVSVEERWNGRMFVFPRGKEIEELVER